MSKASSAARLDAYSRDEPAIAAEHLDQALARLDAEHEHREAAEDLARLDELLSNQTDKPGESRYHCPVLLALGPQGVVAVTQSVAAQRGRIARAMPLDTTQMAKEHHEELHVR